MLVQNQTKFKKTPLIGICTFRQFGNDSIKAICLFVCFHVGTIQFFKETSVANLDGDISIYF